MLSVREAAKKYRNLRRDPHVALSCADPHDPERYVELRGEVIDFTLYTTLDFVNALAHKYTGADSRCGHAGERRSKLTIHVDAWTAQG